MRALESIHADMKESGAARARADIMNAAFDDLDLDPERVMTALRVQAAATRNPALTVADVLASLDRCGAHEFAMSARRQLWRTT